MLLARWDCARMAILRMARLEYYIIERVLRGTADHKPVQFFAVSGGAGEARATYFPLKSFRESLLLSPTIHTSRV